MNLFDHITRKMAIVVTDEDKGIKGWIAKRLHVTKENGKRKEIKMGTLPAFATGPFVFIAKGQLKEYLQDKKNSIHMCTVEEAVEDQVNEWLVHELTHVTQWWRNPFNFISSYKANPEICIRSEAEATAHQLNFIRERLNDENSSYSKYIEFIKQQEIEITKEQFVDNVKQSAIVSLVCSAFHPTGDLTKEDVKRIFDEYM